MIETRDPEMVLKGYLGQFSDIQGHLEFLRDVAKGFVVECGVRSGVSTAALLAGVVKNGGRLVSIDVDHCQSIFEGHPDWTFIRGSSIDPNTLPVVDVLFDVVFLDTLHTYEHVKAELELWGPRVAPGGMILVHDVDTFKGAGDAVSEWVAARKLDYQIRHGSNGLGVVKIPKGGL